MMDMYIFPSCLTNNAAKNVLVIFFFSCGRPFPVWWYLDGKFLDGSVCTF